MIEQITDQFFERKSLDDFVLDPILEEERKNFRFPADFSFKNEEHRRTIDRLYGRKNFEIHGENREKKKEDRKKRKIIRNDYQEKCKEYFIEQHHWPKKVAGVVSSIVSLPKCEEHRTKAGHAVMFLPAAFAGNLSERYAGPLSQVMNLEPEYLTASSIAWDTANLAIAGTLAYALWTGGNHHETFIEKFYDFIGVGKDIFKWMITANFATRFIEIPIRLIYYGKDKTHTFSPAAHFPLNPNPFDGIPFTYLTGHDAVMGVKEKTKKYDLTFDGFKNGFKKTESVPVESRESNYQSGSKIA